MTYFGFLGWFLVLPIVALAAVALWDQRRGRAIPTALSATPLWLAIALHVLIALIYTTPWDNYLVATSVWWYNPALVTGITLGWVPIEEYTFFVVQPILAGLWLGFLARRLKISEEPLRPGLRLWSAAGLGALWLVMLALLLAGGPAWNYMGLILVWALPPVALQLFFGADILWRHRRLLLLSIGVMTLYLAAADSLAIGGWGIWTIDSAQSLHLLLGGVLPLEEFVFFLMTNVLLTFGVVLLVARASHERFAALRQWLQRLTQREESNARYALEAKTQEEEI